MIVITGSTGFIGGAVLQQSPNAVVLGRSCPLGFEGKYIKKNISPDADYMNCFEHVKTIVHCAARTHVMDEESLDPLMEYRKVNTGGTLNLARQAAQAGVKRFIFISSIKVNGERTSIGVPFKPKVSVAPIDPYGLSKYEAEKGLQKIADNTNMDVVIIRPPLVYGPGVQANFLSMLKITSKGYPLPFGAMTKNRRSLVSLDNLVDLIVTCIEHPMAANETFLVSDNADLSTADLFRRLSVACGKPVFLLSVPVFLFKIGFKLIGKAEHYQRLCGSLQVDISATMEKLSWKPPCTIDDSLAKTAVHYLENKV